MPRSYVSLLTICTYQASVGHATKTNMAPKKSVEPPETANSASRCEVSMRKYIITGRTINTNNNNNKNHANYIDHHHHHQPKVNRFFVGGLESDIPQ